ncbi:GHKL domain-containing protein [Verrucomicrobiaceae bacterium R5-34]|nr:GHKL domain-containing protein [Verrucomicrobiaceae bacterium R5-34]
MKKTSIQNKLLVGMVFFMTTVLTVGSTALYFSFRKAYFQQIDLDLGKVATLLATEIELENGQLVHEWLDDVRNDPIRSKKDLIQSWNLSDGSSLRSPALKGEDLPKFSAPSGQSSFRDITLPNGHSGRAIGIEILPKIDPEETEENATEPHGPYTEANAPPHILVIANDVEKIEKQLARLRWILLLTIIAVVIASVLISRNIIRSCLFPINDLSDQVAQHNVNELDKEFLVTPDFPEELKGLVTQYNRLFKNIHRVRVRERDFSAHAAHELRTPLAGIILTLEQALHRNRDTDYYQECLAETLKISQSMHGMTERLLYFSRLQNDTFSMHFEKVALHELLKNVWLQHTNRADSRGLSIDWDLTDKAAVIRADQHLLGILISNLMNNAVAYAEPNSSITIQTTAQSSGLALSISNQSKGLNKENMRRLFEPFYRKDEARDVNEHHSGIGLALCQEITRAMRASITADLDEENNTFTITVCFTALVDSEKHAIS